MPDQWHYLIEGEQRGPISTYDLQELAEDGLLTPDDLVWKEGMRDWVPAARVPELFPSQPPPIPTGGARRSHYNDYDDDREYHQFVNNKIIAGLCGIFLGPLGVHKFILGLNTPGVIMLAISVLTCGIGTIVTAPLGLIEGIVYLTKTDEDFYETYAIEKREWF